MNTPTKTSIGTAWIDTDGILRHRLDAGIRISEDLARASIPSLAELAAGKPRPAVTDIRAVLAVDPESRILFAKLGAAVPVLATALIVGPDENPASGVVAFQLSLLKLDRPVAIFEKESDALAWAKGFLPGA